MRSWTRSVVQVHEPAFCIRYQVIHFEFLLRASARSSGYISTWPGPLVLRTPVYLLRSRFLPFSLIFFAFTVLLVVYAYVLTGTVGYPLSDHPMTNPVEVVLSRCALSLRKPGLVLT